VCSGECSTGRWFCPREIYAYFREAWLERVESPLPESHTPLDGNGTMLPLPDRDGALTVVQRSPH
jgi:hypothetical protein